MPPPLAFTPPAEPELPTPPMPRRLVDDASTTTHEDADTKLHDYDTATTVDGSTRSPAASEPLAAKPVVATPPVVAPPPAVALPPVTPPAVAPPAVVASPAAAAPSLPVATPPPSRPVASEQDAAKIERQDVLTAI